MSVQLGCAISDFFTPIQLLPPFLPRQLEPTTGAPLDPSLNKTKRLQKEKKKILDSNFVLRGLQKATTRLPPQKTDPPSDSHLTLDRALPTSAPYCPRVRLQ